MHIVLVVALLGSVGLGFQNDWAGVHAYKSYNECREANPKFHNTMTQWKYDPCNAVAYKLQNK